MTAAASHRWVVTPTFVTALFERHKSRRATQPVRRANVNPPGLATPLPAINGAMMT